MFAGLIRNVAISAAAFGAVSVVGLLLVPVLLHAYGIERFGLIALARLFLPVAAFAVLDMGFTEIATHAVASARANGDWSRCSRTLALALRTALGIGTVCGLGMWLASAAIPGWNAVAVEDRAALVLVLQVTACLLPLLFASMVFEGVLKGCENFAAQRGIEVVAALTYAALALTAVYRGAGFAWVCIALLVSLVLRATLAATFAFRVCWRHRAGSLQPAPEVRHDVVAHARVLWQSKILGAVQANAPSLLVSAVIGPAALGVYDVLSRMPRFAKAVLGLLSSTVQPMAVRLESQPDASHMSRLGRLGLLLVAAIAAPVLGAAMAFSEPILRLWLAPSIAVLWPWQALYFVVPALSAMVGFGASALLSRKNVVGTMNRLTMLHVTVTLAVGAATMGVLQERAFIVGQVAASVCTFPLFMRIIRDEMDVRAGTIFQLARLFAVALAMAAATLIIARQIDTVAVLLACLAGWIVLCWLVCLLIALERPYRVRLLQEVAQRTGAALARRRRP